MVECNRGCGEANLHWKVVNGKYKLFCDENLLHICNEGKKLGAHIRESATVKILNELGIKDVKEIPTPDVAESNGHKKQTDYWFCPKGSFKVGLGRPREDGGVDVFWYYLSDKNFHVLQIPPGIWHGYKALEMNSIMLYYLSEKYDENDEEKVLPGHFGEDWRTISK